jgi:hypothetical protein
MSFSTSHPQPPLAKMVSIAGDLLIVELLDGRTASAPLRLYPRLLHGSPEEQRRWRLIGQGSGIQWSELDEDISITNILEQTPSRESSSSFERWKRSRNLSGI